MAVDAKGNVYTAEVDNGKRVQKFKPTSDALR
jgi:sugar lactone lactonase YvrE